MSVHFLQSLRANDSATLQAIVTDMMDTLKTSQSQKLAKSIVREARRSRESRCAATAFVFAGFLWCEIR